MISKTCLCLFMLAAVTYSAPREPAWLESRQGTTRSDAVSQSSDVWASVVANVAPLMALVGEKNAKEFMRTAPRSSLWLLAAAPLGILSIVVSAIRLGGPRTLKQLVGRSSDRRIETLVELTALSVEPATAIYTPRSIEVEAGSSRDNVAYVCAYVKHTTQVSAALNAFKTMLQERDEDNSPDRDFEIVLALKDHGLTLRSSLEVLLAISRSDCELNSSHEYLFKAASLGFRTTGISPTQTDSKGPNTAVEGLSSLSKQIPGLLAVMGLVGLQIAGYIAERRSNLNARQTIVMGLVGYGGIFVSSTKLLYMIREEVKAKAQHLPRPFEEACWTFSDSRHAEHQNLDIDPLQQLYIVEPSTFDNNKVQKRALMTTVLCATVVASFVLYYLSVRVAPWWVAFGSLMVIWANAALRTLMTRSYLEAASERSLGEHWLGLFRDTLYDSLLATISSTRDPESDPEVGVPGGVDLLQTRPKAESESTGLAPRSAFLITVKPVRQSLHNWSGCEDIIKVALELTRRKCESHTVKFDSIVVPKTHKPGLRSSSWRRIVRFRPIIFVPGLVWQSDVELDLALTEDLNIPDLYRDLLKIVHLCGDFTGQVKKHDLSTREQIALSHVLCGPVTMPEDNALNGSMTLTQSLRYLRDLTPSSSKCYTLEQSILMPCAQLASMRESWDELTRSRILSFQREYTDRLALSGIAQLQEMEAVLETVGVWDSFMQEKSGGQETLPQARNDTSGHYGAGKYGGHETRWTRDATYEDDARNDIEKY